MQPVRFAGIGAYTPSRRITNEHWAGLAETSDQWIRDQVGIRTRSRVEPGQTTIDMGVLAAEAALQDAHIKASDLARVICATNSQPHLYPSSASQIQERLGAEQAASFDVQAGCTGWLYGLQLASALLAAETLGPVLVVGTDALSLALNMYDRSSLLFGDGAGAVVLLPGVGKASGPGKTRASRLPRPLFELRTAPSMAMRQATIVDEDRNRFEDYLAGKDMSMVERPLPHMDGKASLRLALNETRACLDAVLDRAKREFAITPADLDHFVPHQTNSKVVRALCEHVAFPFEKIPYILEELGGISTAGIPTGLSRLRAAGRLNSGDLILVCGYGAGFTSAAVLFEWAGA